MKSEERKVKKFMEYAEKHVFVYSFIRSTLRRWFVRRWKVDAVIPYKMLKEYYSYPHKISILSGEEWGIYCSTFIRWVQGRMSKVKGSKFQAISHRQQPLPLMMAVGRLRWIPLFQAFIHPIHSYRPITFQTSSTNSSASDKPTVKHVLRHNLWNSSIFILNF